MCNCNLFACLSIKTKTNNTHKLNQLDPVNVVEAHIKTYAEIYRGQQTQIYYNLCSLTLEHVWGLIIGYTVKVASVACIFFKNLE